MPGFTKTAKDGTVTAKKRPKTPGEILNDEYLKPLGITQQQLAERLGITRVRLNEVLLGKRSISMDTAIRLARFFKTTVDFWIGLQSGIDQWDAMKNNQKEYDKITPLGSDKSRSRTNDTTRD